jgi:stress response protein SCP2
MQCSNCNVKKLSNEFPQRRSSTCRHFPSWCLKCVVSDTSGCNECGSPYDHGILEELHYHLNLIIQPELLKPPPRIVIPTHPGRAEPIKFKVSLIGGDSTECNMSTNTSVSALMNHLHVTFGLPNNLQRLIFNGQQLKKYTSEGESQLRNYNITNGSSLQLMKQLLSVTQDTPYDTIMFNLTYGRGTDFKFLDASCLTYSGPTFYNTVDFKHTYVVPGIYHSGPAYNSGRHTVQVRLVDVPRNVTHLFFVMSACHSATLRGFTSPTVSLYDTARPREQLSSYSIAAREHGHSQAVIMCCMRRTNEGWEAFSLGAETSGYCYDYYPIQNTITRLFAAKTV